MSASPIEDWITSSLSREQQRPFAGKASRSSILAAAGSGKTRTLTHLLAHDLCSGIPATGIVAFTFTEKVAEELFARIHFLRNERMPNVDLSGIFVGTIHTWCLQYLYSQPDFYSVQPLDELHLDSLVARLYDHLDLAKTYKKSFPLAIRPFLADLEIFYNEHLSAAEVPPAVAPALTSFLRILSTNQLLPFGGMIRSATKHLETSGPLPNLHSLYVDEFQDVNPAQTALIKAMISPHTTLRVVGDDLQSIYNWRGSDVTRILDFPNEFHPAEVFRLSTNFRSRPEIVRAANAVAETINVKDPEKVMRSGRGNCGQANIHWISTRNESDQAAATVEIVKRFRKAGVPYSKIAILIRSVTGAGKPIYEALTAAGIPVECPVLSRGGAFVDKFLLPVLEWLLADQFEPKNPQEEEEYEEKANLLWSSVAPWFSEEFSESVFWSALNQWHDHIRQGVSSAYNVRGCLYDFLDKCGTRVTVSDSNLMVGIGIASQIIRRVEEIHRRRIKGQQRRSAVGVVREVYYALKRNQDRFGESLPINQNAVGVVLSTVHQAKGLEWPIVCLPMLNARRFPLSDRPARTSFPKYITDRYGTKLDDERRLFYVAVTRAREQLFLLDTSADNATSRSIFIEDLGKSGILPKMGLAEPRDPIWSIDPSNLREDDQPPIRVGLSDLLLFLECPYQFGLRKVAGLQPAVGDELGFGKGLHELLQRRAESDHVWDHDKVMAEVDRHVHIPLTSQKAEEISKNAIAQRIMALDRLGAFAGELQLELPVELVLKDGVITGVIDFVRRQPDGSAVIRDWKATVHDKYRARYSRQLQVYTHTLHRQQQVVRKAELVDVASSMQTNELVTAEVDISKATISNLIRNCEQALEAIRHNKFEPTPSVDVCGTCDVRQICGESRGTIIEKNKKKRRHLGFDA